MTTPSHTDSIQTLDIRNDVFIAASPEIAFASLLEELGPGSQMPDGTPFPMKVEPWPGGRWFRDLGHTGGHAYGHLWGHVQVIKAPFLLELTGPMMMSFAATNHVQYRLTPEGSGTRLSLIHRALGTILPEHREGMPKGWEYGLSRVRQVAEQKSGTAHAKV
ncbi:MAG: SRPBCC domain-containing protein [Planctomycetota bacterium]|nr:SRPBCC domain-containing protein [Planctomycetota bacterium]